MSPITIIKKLYFTTMAKRMTVQKTEIHLSRGWSKGITEDLVPELKERLHCSLIKECCGKFSFLMNVTQFFICAI